MGRAGLNWRDGRLAIGSLIYRTMGDMDLTVLRLNRDAAPYHARVMRNGVLLISNNLETLPEARRWALAAAIMEAKTWLELKVQGIDPSQ